jgi:hypothetical protein
MNATKPPAIEPSTLEAAFDAIRSAAYFDCLTPVPHPDNLAFLVAEERRALRSLGMKLADVSNDPEGQGTQYSAHAIQHCFWRELGLAEEPESALRLPSYLQPEVYAMPHIDLADLSNKLAAMVLPDAPVPCIVYSNLIQLQRLLNLSDITVKFLTAAYAMTSLHTPRNETSSLNTALSFIGIPNAEYRNRAVSLFLNEPLEAVERLFALPSTLVALGFMDVQASYQHRSLQELCLLTDAFVTLLESPHQSTQSLLTDILEPTEELEQIRDGTVPVSYLYEVLPQATAECFERALWNVPLTPSHIQQLVAWWTGGYVLPLEALEPLHGHITFECIREAIKQTALAVCQTDQSFDAFALLKGLYAASA